MNNESYNEVKAPPMYKLLLLSLTIVFTSLFARVKNSHLFDGISILDMRLPDAVRRNEPPTYNLLYDESKYIENILYAPTLVVPSDEK